MDVLLQVIIIIASILLVLLIFVQNPKGGGLSADFGAAQQIGGVKKTNDFIDKSTWSLAGLIAVCSIVLAIRLAPAQTKVVIDNKVDTSAQNGPADQSNE